MSRRGWVELGVVASGVLLLAEWSATSAGEADTTTSAALHDGQHIPRTAAGPGR